MMHNSSSPLARQDVTLNAKASDPMRGILVEGTIYEVEDWFDVMSGGISWRDLALSNYAAMHYAKRVELTGLPTDDDVLYGKVNGLGHMVHASEIG